MWFTCYNGVEVVIFSFIVMLWLASGSCDACVARLLCSNIKQPFQCVLLCSVSQIIV
jgi:hypothetical protein